MVPQTLNDSAHLIGEPARLAMLWALLDRRAYTAGELARVADVSAASASMHLSRLLEAGWLSVQKQGRHRYYVIAQDEVAHAVEAIAALRPGAVTLPVRRLPEPRLRHARSCYGHLAGAFAVALWQALLSARWIRAEGQHFFMTPRGLSGLSEIARGDVHADDASGLIKPCMDWTERTYHLGGRCGRDFFDAMARQGAIIGMPRSRAVSLAPGVEQRIWAALKQPGIA